MKIVSVPAEVKALRSIFGDNERVAAKILASTDVSTFHYPPIKDTYSFIRRTLAANGDLPSWTEVCTSPELNEKVRAVLRGIKEPPLREERHVGGLVKTLDKYRKLRVLFQLVDEVGSNLEGDQVDVDELIDHATSILSKTRVSSGGAAKITHFGKGNNSSDIIKNVLNAQRKPFVPTGFRGFDDKNGGVQRGSLMMIGGFTGLGKTALGVNLLMNMTACAEDVAFVSLEMTREQLTARIQGILTGQIVKDIMQGKMTPEEKQTAIKAYKRWITDLKENNTRYTMYEADEDVDIQDVLMTLKPYGHSVILIDYISLLKGVQGDDQWKKLLEVTRYAKRYAANNGVSVVLLFQTTKEGAISFSKNMANDCDVMWVLTGPTEDMDIMPIQVTQLKARNLSRHPFSLLNDTKTMRMWDDDGAMPQDDSQDTAGEGEASLPDINDAPSDSEDESEYDS